MTTTATKYMQDHYNKIVGCKILRTGFLPCSWDTRNPFPTLQLQTPEGALIYVTVQSDAEGNGAGFLDIQP